MVHHGRYIFGGKKQLEKKMRRKGEHMLPRRLLFSLREIQHWNNTEHKKQTFSKIEWNAREVAIQSQVKII